MCKTKYSKAQKCKRKTTNATIHYMLSSINFEIKKSGQSKLLKKGRNLESSKTPIKMQISTLWLTLLRWVQKKSQWKHFPFLAPLHFHELFNENFEFFNIQLQVWLSDWVSVNAFGWQKWIPEKYHADSLRFSRHLQEML